MWWLFIVVRAGSVDYPLYAGHIWSFYWNSRWHGHKAVETFFWSPSGRICNTSSFLCRVLQLSCNLLMCWSYLHCKRHLQPNRLGNFVVQWQELEDNLPMASKFKSKGVTASPIRVIQLLYNSGVRTIYFLFLVTFNAYKDVSCEVIEIFLI